MLDAVGGLVAHTASHGGDRLDGGRREGVCGDAVGGGCSFGDGGAGDGGGGDAVGVAPAMPHCARTERDALELFANFLNSRVC